MNASLHFSGFNFHKHLFLKLPYSSVHQNDKSTKVTMKTVHESDLRLHTGKSVFISMIINHKFLNLVSTQLQKNIEVLLVNVFKLQE